MFRQISAKAVKRARLLGRPAAAYEAADILSYAPREAYDAILLREVIYQLPPAKVSGFLRRVSGYLAPGGVIVIQVWPGERSPGLAAAIEASALPVMLEKTLDLGRAHPVVFLLGRPGSLVSAPASAQRAAPAR